ncbi:hypothetical protein MesoLjLc_73080 [Mesorhizobium sp. L-8-10]|nr:hypothetical protein MesoLjLc_73080 [Mesorhizobium sp. L-8-10]
MTRFGGFVPGAALIRLAAPSPWKREKDDAVPPNLLLSVREERVSGFAERRGRNKSPAGSAQRANGLSDMS